jgi:ribosomal protein L9
MAMHEKLLIPRSLAYYASPSYINVFESEKKRHMAEMARKKEAAELLASKLSENSGQCSNESWRRGPFIRFCNSTNDCT